MPDEEVRKAQEEADKALQRMTRRKNFAERLAEGWKEARSDNNFREMIRRLPPIAGEGR